MRADRDTIARIVTSNGRTWWRCPSCMKKLAEIDGDQVVIKSGNYWIVIRLTNDQTIRCPSPACSTESTLRVDRAA